MTEEMPVTKDYLEMFVEKAIGSCRRGESNTMVYVPGSGRTSYFRFLSEKKKDLGMDFGNLVWLLVQSNDGERVRQEWLRMGKEQGILEKDYSAKTTEEILEEIIKVKKYRVLLSVKMDKGGPSLKQLNRYKSVAILMIDFNFCFPYEITTDEVRDELKELAPLALQNWWYLPLLPDEDVNFMVKRRVGKEINEVVALANGCPPLVRYFIRNQDKMSENSWNEPEVKLYLDELWQALSLESQKWIRGGSEAEASEYLKQTGLVKICPSLQQYILQAAAPEIKLTLQENRVFDLLKTKKGNVVKREEISDVIWGKLSEEKYSDWAINQLMRRLRQKTVNENVAITTIRDEGFILE